MTKKKQIPKAEWVDPDDAPHLDREWFERADYYEGGKLIRRGRPRQSVRIRLDADLIAHYRATGRAWQARLNADLRKAAGLETP